MSSMRKVAAVMGLVLAVSLMGCGGNNDDSKASDATPKGASKSSGPATTSPNKPAAPQGQTTE